MNEQTKFLIIGTGRNGSSLLGAILAGAGARFGLAQKDKWDRVKGDFEHPILYDAHKWFSRAKKYHFKALKKIADGRLKKVFKQADYAKSSQLVYLVPRASQLGYQIKIIGVYRNFSDYFLSRQKKFGGAQEHWQKVWLEINNQILEYQKQFPTVLISYKDLVDFSKDSWAKRLNRLTGLDQQVLLSAREKIVDQEIAQRKPRDDFDDFQTKQLYQELNQHSSQLITNN